MEIAKDIVEASAAARSSSGIQLRYQLPALTVSGSREALSASRALVDVIASLANVEKVKTGKVMADVTAKPNWSAAGKKFGPKVQELAQVLAKADAAKLREKLKKEGKAAAGDFTVTSDDITFVETAKAKGVQFRGGTVFLDTTVSQTLKHRWLVRELIRAVQEKRKELGLRVTDRVNVRIADDTFKKSLKLIERQTGSKLTFGKLAGSKGKIEFEGKAYEFGVEKR